jgi:hypothetical protein
MLDSHPEVAVPPEAQFLVPAIRRRRVYESGGSFDFQRFLDDMRSHERFRQWRTDTAVAADSLGDEPRNLGDALRLLFALYAHEHGKSRYADKTPNHVLYMPLLADTFPEAKFIHIVRDGRDVALSWTEAEFGPRTTGAAALAWRRRVLHGERAGRVLGPERYLRVQYEALVVAPVEELERVCDFVEIDFHPNMLEYSKNAERLSSATRYPHRHTRLMLAPTSGVRNWRMQMRVGDVALFQAVAGSTLQMFGYELAPLAARRRAPARAGAAAVEARRIWHELRRFARRMLHVG